MKEKIRTVLRWVLAAFMIAAGINHFRDPNFYLRIMPDYMPLHWELVILSGVAEIAFGIMVLFAKSRRLGGWLMVAMLLVFFTVHIDMLVHAHDKFSDMPMAALWIRIPIQFLLIWWVLWATNIIKKTRRQEEGSRAGGLTTYRSD